MGMYYNKQGREISLTDLTSLFEDNAYRQVAYTEFRDGSYLSTVWLGINHHHGEGPPVIFESMYFGNSDDNDRTRRYSTEAEALAGHQDILRELSPLVEDITPYTEFELQDRFDLLLED